MGFKGVFRSKGQVWLANAHAYPLVYHTAGRTVNLRPHPNGMPFMHAAIPVEEWESDELGWATQKKKLIKDGKWNDTFRDRCSELVFIGVNLNKPLMEKKLTEALLTDMESEALGGVSGWWRLEDPFFSGGCVPSFFEVDQRPSWWQPPEFQAVL